MMLVIIARVRTLAILHTLVALVVQSQRHKSSWLPLYQLVD